MILQHLLYIVGNAIDISCRLGIAWMLYQTESNLRLMIQYNESYLLFFIFGSILLLFLGIGCGRALADASDSFYYNPNA